MRMKVSFSLPRIPQTVAAARTLLDGIFRSLGVRADCREEIAVAVSEACGNAVRHASGPTQYHLAVATEGSDCTIEVSDEGPGLGGPVAQTMPAADAVSGRGFALMRACTDRVELRGRPGGGLSVVLFKRLRWCDGAIGSPPAQVS